MTTPDDPIAAARMDPETLNAARLLSALRRTPDDQLAQFTTRAGLDTELAESQVRQARDLADLLSEALVTGAPDCWDRVTAAWQALQTAEPTPAEAPPSEPDRALGATEEDGPASVEPSASSPPPPLGRGGLPDDADAPPPLAVAPPPRVRSPGLPRAPRPGRASGGPVSPWARSKVPAERPPAAAKGHKTMAINRDELAQPKPAVPFRRDAQAAPPAAETVEPPGGGTATDPSAGAMDIPEEAVLPFKKPPSGAKGGRAPGQPPAGVADRGDGPDGDGHGPAIGDEPPALTVEEYAALCAQCAAHPERQADVQLKYGITSDTERQRLDEQWQHRFGDDAELRRKWQQLLAQYRGWLEKQST